MVSYATGTRTYDNLHKTKLVLLKQMVNNYMRLFLMNGGKTARAIARMAMNARSSVHNAGLAFGMAMTLIVGFLCTHCVHILVSETVKILAPDTGC